MRKIFQSVPACWAWHVACYGFLAANLIYGQWWGVAIWAANVLLSFRLVHGALQLRSEEERLRNLRCSEEEQLAGYTGLFVYPEEQWSQFWSALFGGGHNWYTFDLLQFQVENDMHLFGGVEARVMVLGLGYRFRYNFHTTETVDNIREQVRGIKDGTVETYPLDEVEDDLDRPGN